MKKYILVCFLLVSIVTFSQKFTKEEREQLEKFKRIFINARMIEEVGEEWKFNEGCLSIPEVREDVMRKPNVLISYYDENWVKHEEKVSGFPARVIQHEYDHIDGILFTDHLTSLKKQLLKKKLTNITKGDVDIEYRMKFPK